MIAVNTEALVKKIEEIPSLPSIVYELNRIINDPMSSTKEVESIMSQDIGMTTKVLKLANSAYYAIPGGVTSLSRAIAFIGFDTIHQLVLSASIISALDVKSAANFEIGDFWKHSIAVAIASETIAKYITHPVPADLFTGGLVHDMGKVALYFAAPEALLQIAEQALANNKTFYDIEVAENVTPHTELGRMLAERWQLTKSLQAVIRFHHEGDVARRSGLSADFNQTVDIVMLANLLIHAMKFGNSGHKTILGAPGELLDRLHLHPQGDMPTVIKNIKMQLEQGSEFIKMIATQDAWADRSSEANSEEKAS